MPCSLLFPSPHPHPLEHSFSQDTSPHSFSTSLHNPISYCKSPPLPSFLRNTYYNPSPSRPCYQLASYLLRSSSSNLGVLHWTHLLCLLLLRPSSTTCQQKPLPPPGGSGTSHTSIVSSSQLLFLPSFSLLPELPQIPRSLHQDPSWFQCLAYKTLLVADEKIQVQVAFTGNPLGWDSED